MYQFSPITLQRYILCLYLLGKILLAFAGENTGTNNKNISFRAVKETVHQRGSQQCQLTDSSISLRTQYTRTIACRKFRISGEVVFV
ncbi:hypothetical protein GcC1_c1368o78 [Golovinomyces cichoracearum]|uniref:Secreted protein n=1 Tax=Golovinomyces cichoracearum TaxID=62708 RepID=A0A420J2N3_9PEZI|nr:hypothetical protein GcC1_c1368o78 [Golovinomyces cichoracearum]